MKNLFIMLVMGLLMINVNCWADDEKEGVKIDFNKLPAAVQNVALKYFKVKDIKEIEKKAEEDTAQYCVEGTSKGKKLDLTFAPDGTVIKTTVKTTFESLPELAQKAILNDYPNGEVKEIEKVVETSYKVEIIVNGKKREIEIKASGDIEDENDNDSVNDDNSQDNNGETDDNEEDDD